MNTKAFHEISTLLKTTHTRLIAVSKTKSIEQILALYNEGQRLFGENRVQELQQKYEALPKDIDWHLIGHLQTNKVKYVAPFVGMIHSIDSIKLLAEVNKQAAKNNRIISCLLQIYIADEDTKFGMNMDEVKELLTSSEFLEMKNISICGLMGMATNTDDENKIHNEFKHLRELFTELKTSHFSTDSNFTELSMGMSSDYKIAIQHGATLVRIGSALF